MISVYDEAGNLIETHEHSGGFKATASVYGMSYKSAFRYSVRKPTVEAGADPELLQYRRPKSGARQR